MRPWMFMPVLLLFIFAFGCVEKKEPLLMPREQIQPPPIDYRTDEKTGYVPRPDERPDLSRLKKQYSGLDMEGITYRTPWIDAAGEASVSTISLWPNFEPILYLWRVDDEKHYAAFVDGPIYRVVRWGYTISPLRDRVDFSLYTKDGEIVRREFMIAGIKPAETSRPAAEPQN